jgi:hypothetical protein
MNLSLGLVVSFESDILIARCLHYATRVYKKALSEILIVSKVPRDFSFLNLPVPIKIKQYPDNLKPQFLNMQELYLLYLEQSSAEYLITLDADTLVLDWDGEFHELAGQFICYRPRRLIEYYNRMPPEWQTYNPYYQKLLTLYGIHSIQGGWSMRSRSLAKEMSTLFFVDNGIKWEPQHRGGHELVFGLYLKMLDKESLHKTESVQEWYNPLAHYFCSEPIEKSKELKNVHVVHPIKDDKAFEDLRNYYTSKLTAFPLIES